MNLFDDIKAKADANGDGKLTKDDLNDLEGKVPADKLEELKNIADQNHDGKVDFADVQNFNFGDSFKKAKDSLGGMFGK